MRKVENKTKMKNRRVLFACLTFIVCTACNQGGKTVADTASDVDSLVCPKYATGYQVKDSAGVRLVDVGTDYHFALVGADNIEVPNGYTKVKVPIKSTICMTALQLSNFTILNAHDVVKGLTGTKNLFNKDILERVNDGRIVKIGMEGNFDTEMVIAANPDIIFIKFFSNIFPYTFNLSIIFRFYFKSSYTFIFSFFNCSNISATTTLSSKGYLLPCFS